MAVVSRANMAATNSAGNAAGGNGEYLSFMALSFRGSSIAISFVVANAA